MAQTKTRDADAVLVGVVDVEDGHLVRQELSAPDETTHAEQEALGVGLHDHLISALQDRKGKQVRQPRLEARVKVKLRLFDRDHTLGRMRACVNHGQQLADAVSNLGQWNGRSRASVGRRPGRT